MKHDGASVRTKDRLYSEMPILFLSKVAKSFTFQVFRKYFWVRGLAKYGGASVKTKDGSYPEIPILFLFVKDYKNLKEILYAGGIF